MLRASCRVTSILTYNEHLAISQASCPVTSILPCNQHPAMPRASYYLTKNLPSHEHAATSWTSDNLCATQRPHESSYKLLSSSLLIWWHIFSVKRLCSLQPFKVSGRSFCNYINLFLLFFILFWFFVAAIMYAIFLYVAHNVNMFIYMTPSDSKELRDKK